MGIQENKQLVRRFYEEVVNTGHVDHIAAFIAPECVETDGDVCVLSGIEGMANHVLGVREVYPDLRLSIERQMAEGDWVVTVVTARGTHRGSWLGMKPTGRPLVFTGVNVDKVQDGRIVEHGGAANMLEPFLRAGALRVVSPETEHTVADKDPFIWHELVTPDQQASGAFTRDLFGWTSRAVDAGPFGVYTLFQSGGKDVAGMMNPTPETAGRESFWHAYVAVANVDDCARRVPMLGGRVLVPPHDVPEFGRVCAIADPTGAVAHLVQPAGT